jgi:hypothetical protein
VIDLLPNFRKNVSRNIICLIVACILSGIVCIPVLAADANIEAELGDTLTLHGVSYTSNQVYLFLTGPGLPENGVTLTDVTQRADRGQFTTVDVDNSQQWSYRWNTARIEPNINYGTYTVYVSTEPVDKANLGGTNTYKTLEVFLTDSGTSKVSVSSGPSYTLNPEMHSSRPAPALNFTSPTPIPTSLPTTVAPVLTTPSPPPTTKAPLQLSTTLLAGVLCGGFILLSKKK